MADEDDDNDPQVIRPPDTLKAKVSEGGPGAVDLAALERAEQVIADLTGNYLEWVQEDLARIQGAFDKFGQDDADNQEVADEVFQIAHDIKGQGGSFGFDLMTHIGNSLCRFIEKLDKVGPKEIEVIRLHIDSMKLVITKNIQGDGGEAGNQLLDGLDEMTQKFLRGE